MKPSSKVRRFKRAAQLFRRGEVCFAPSDHVRGKRIRAWRGSDSLEQVAAAAGVSRQTVANWETGSSEPRLCHLIACERFKSGFQRACGLVLASGAAA